jgi:protein involved in polysaccharide export with SLBB domain
VDQSSQAARSETPAVWSDSAEGGAQVARLQALWDQRKESEVLNDYPIGAGDVISVSVPAMEELRDRTARVSADGTVALPLIGTVQAGGLTEAQFRDELANRLKDFMHQPEFEVFVKEYRSRQVAVVGALRQPGLVTLKGSRQTILDAISEAGGLSPDAGDEIIYFPVEDSPEESAAPRPRDEGLRWAGISNGSSGSPSTNNLHKASASFDRQGVSSSIAGTRGLPQPPAKRTQPIFMSLTSTSMAGAGRYVHLPVRPGDVIVVPASGEVMVIGWVQSPGHFRAGSGLTLLGVIGAAGGPMFAADTENIRLIRTEKDGSKVAIRVNLDDIARGEATDISVRANDVVDVPYSNIKIGPYVAYNVLMRIGAGVSLPLIP